MNETKYIVLMLSVFFCSITFYVWKKHQENAIKSYYHGEIRTYLSYEDARSIAMEENKPLLLWFNGYACSSNRSYDYFLQEDPRISFKLNQQFVVAMLMVDDQTPLPTTEVREVSIGNLKKTINTVGNKNSWFQVSRFQNNTQPFFVAVSPNGEEEFVEFGYVREADRMNFLLGRALDKFEAYTGSHP